MSKKMLKRSLALGAMMAFVITGSAMAAETLNSDKTVSGIIDKGYFGTDAVWTGESKEKIWNLNDNTLTVNGVASADNKAIFLDGYNISGSKNSSLIINADGMALSAQGVVNVGTINITSGSNAISAYGNQYGLDKEDTVITADNITLTTTNGGNGLYTQFAKAKLIVNVGKSLVINSSGHGINSGVLGSGITDSTTIEVKGSEGSSVSVNAAENAIDSRGYGSKIEISGVKNVTVKSTNTGEKDADWKGYAVMSRAEGSSVEINATGDIDITSARTAVYANKGKIDVVGKTIDILAGEGAGVRAGTSAKSAVDGTDSVRGNGHVVLGDTNTQSITIEGNMDYGIIARAKNNTGDVDVQSSVVVNGDSLVIGAKSDSDIYAGICAASGTEAKTEYNSSSVTVNTGYTEINADYGIYNMSNGNVTIDGDLTINANESAIVTRGYADTIINGDAKEDITVKITGDIEFNKYYNNATSVTDSNVTLNLSNPESVFEGNIIVTNRTTGDNPVSDANKATINQITGMKLALSNGAQWKLNKASVVNQASFVNNAVLVLENGSNFEKKAADSENVYALNAGGGDANSLTIDSTAKLQIGNIKETTYNIATGFKNYDVANSIDIADNALLQANKILEGNNYQVEIKAKDIKDMAADTGMSTSTAGLVDSIIKNADSDAAKVEGSPEKAAVDFINNVVKEHGSNPAAVGNAINAATKMAEAGGNNATAANIVKNVTGVTNDRLSFNCGHSAPHKGGHGVGLFEEGSGADIWVEYVHGKDEVEDMPSTAGATSYEGQYNGIVMGVDFKKVNKFQSGVAFNYGEGDTNSIGGVARTHSDYDFWGIGYYGNIHNDDSNVIFDINYAKTDSDVTQDNSGHTFEASPETTTWSAGVKVEKLYQNENVQIVPYTGLRYMSIDSDDYSTSGGEFNYSMERQDIWLLPLGVSIRQEIENDNGWTVSPRVDLSYIWAFGDTNSNMEVKSPFSGVSQLGYDVMDDGSFLGLVGIEAHKGQWGYGVSYSYQKGDHSESKKWYVDVNYSF